MFPIDLSRAATVIVAVIREAADDMQISVEELMGKLARDEISGPMSLHAAAAACGVKGQQAIVDNQMRNISDEK